MRKAKLVVVVGTSALMLGLFAVGGYFARPWINELIPGQMEKKLMPELGSIYKRSATLEHAIRNPVIVAHSMGGLVARYYLRYGDQGPAVHGNVPELNWVGCEHVDRVFMIGTPNRGSAKSLVSTHEGFGFSFLFDVFPSGLVASLPSIYQLLPNGPTSIVYDEATGQPVNHYDIKAWDQWGWGMKSSPTRIVDQPDLR